MRWLTKIACRIQGLGGSSGLDFLIRIGSRIRRSLGGVARAAGRVLRVGRRSFAERTCSCFWFLFWKATFVNNWGIACCGICIMGSSAAGWWLMLRLLGVLIAICICIVTAPWGILVGAVLLIGWLFVKPAPPRKEVRNVDVGMRLLRSIPLVNAAYCADCDLITDTPHDACGVCGSRSVVSVSRMLQRSWQPAAAQPFGRSARYRLNLTAELREIPADGLDDITKLMTRLAESGGRVERLHVNVEPFSSASELGAVCRTVVAPLRRTVATTCRELRRAS